MKITKKQLRQIIKEEIQIIENDENLQEEAEGLALKAAEKVVKLNKKDEPNLEKETAQEQVGTFFEEIQQNEKLETTIDNALASEEEPVKEASLRYADPDEIKRLKKVYAGSKERLAKAKETPIEPEEEEEVKTALGILKKFFEKYKS